MSMHCQGRPAQAGSRPSHPFVDIRPQTPTQVETNEGALVIGRKGLEVLSLAAARSGEVRGASRDEMNIDQAQWYIPRARMKAMTQLKAPSPGPG